MGSQGAALRVGGDEEDAVSGSEAGRGEDLDMFDCDVLICFNGETDSVDIQSLQALNCDEHQAFCNKATVSQNKELPNVFLGQQTIDSVTTTAIQSLVCTMHIHGGTSAVNIVIIAFLRFFNLTELVRLRMNKESVISQS